MIEFSLETVEEISSSSKRYSQAELTTWHWQNQRGVWKMGHREAWKLAETYLIIFLQGGHSQLSSTAALPGVALHTEADLHIEVGRHTGI